MNRAPGSELVRDAAFIFIAAVCLGFAYNAASPLGVRWAAGAITPAPAAEPALPTGAPDPALRNETLTAVILPDDPAAVRPVVGQKLPATMAWAEVKPLLAKGEIVLVDARDTLAYEAGHIPGAVSLPVDAFNEKIAAFTASIPKTRPLVFYCASIRCRLAHEAAVLLSGQFGYTDVREMPCGYAEWMVMEPNATPTTGGAR
jgi:rhodanese-related sulfurtransferase